MSERATAVLTPPSPGETPADSAFVIPSNEVSAAWALHEATGKMGTGEVVNNGSLNGALMDDYATRIAPEAEEPLSPIDLAKSLLEEFRAVKNGNRMSSEEFDSMASVFEAACSSVIEQSGKPDDQKQENRSELSRYVARYRSINASKPGKRLRDTTASIENESKIGELFPLDAKAEATRKERAERTAVRGPINVVNAKANGVLTKEELNDSERRGESFAGLKAGIKIAQKERADRKAADHKAKAIEARKNSYEINALNEASRANIYGSADRKFINNDGSERPRATGKLYEMLRDPKFGDTRAEREESVRQYKADVDGLLADGYELCQAELILDLRQADKDRIAEILDTRMVEGRDVKPPKKELTPKQQQDLAKSLLNEGSTTKTTAERLYEEAEKADEERLRLMREGGAFTYSDLQALKAGRELYPMPPSNNKRLVNVDPNTTKLLDRDGIRREVLRKKNEKETQLLNQLNEAIDAYNKAGKADNAEEAQAEAIGSVIGLMGQVKEEFGDKMTPELEKEWRASINKKLGLPEDGTDKLDADKTPEALEDARLAELAELYKAAIASNDDAAQQKIANEAKGIFIKRATGADGKLDDAKMYKSGLAWLETAGDGLTQESYAEQYDKFKIEAARALKRDNEAESDRLKARAIALSEHYFENDKDLKESERAQNMKVIVADIDTPPTLRERFDYFRHEKGPKARNKRVGAVIGAVVVGGGILIAALSGRGDSHSAAPATSSTTVESTVPGAGGPTTTATAPRATLPGGLRGGGGSADLSKPFQIEGGSGYTIEMEQAIPGFSGKAYKAVHEAAVAKFGPNYIDGVPKYQTASGEWRFGSTGTGTVKPEVLKFIEDYLATYR